MKKIDKEALLVKLPVMAVRPRTLSIAFIAALVIGAPGGAVFAQTCLTTDVLSPAGAMVTSPYGVDRTGRASAGWHQGLDITNSAGMGDPIKSGSTGVVTHRRQEHGAGEYMVVTSGDMRFVYMHLRRGMPELSGKTVQAGQQIGELGCSGMSQCAPHLHLGAMMRGDALQNSGAGGRVWREGATKQGTPLTGDALKDAMPTAWYLVNPEPYLPRQIPMDGSGGKQAVYGPQLGGWRSQTLPRTCSPDQTILDNPHVASTTDTGAASNSIDRQATSKSGSEGYSATTAGQERRGLAVEYARLVATDLAATNQLAALRNQAQIDSALAHLLVATVEERGHVR